MALSLHSLSLKHFRNLQTKNIQFSEALTILQGPNASGKTNTLEAIQLICTGYSSKHSTAEHLLQKDSSQGLLKGKLLGDQRVLDIEIHLHKEDKPPQEAYFIKTYIKNGKKVKLSALSGTLPTILFTPDHLRLIKDSARIRREEIDTFCVQLSQPYQSILKTYQRTLEQRNKLLKENPGNNELLHSLDEILSRNGAQLVKARMQCLEHLKPFYFSMYQEIAPKEEVSFEYISPGISLVPHASLDDIKEKLLQGLKEKQDQDKQTGATSIGPHRDDILFCLNGQSARIYGSQGQQRSLVLAWKLALVRYTEEYLGKRPLLLLDDVMSELDATRRETITHFLQQDIQTVITTTHEGYFDKGTLNKAEIIPYP